MRAIRLILLTALLSAVAASAVFAQDGTSVVAEVGGHKVTLAELQQKDAAKLLKARYDLYVAERKALDELVDQTLLEMQAKRENLTVDQLLDRHVKSKVTDPTEDQLEVYYEGVQTDKPFSEVRDQVLAAIRELRTERATKAYIESLHAQANVLISLAPPAAHATAGSAPVRGPQAAPLTVIEFADYECPYCRQVDPELEKLPQEFPGKVNVAFKDFPLPVHKNAEKAAEAARCAGEQGAFWPFHDRLFANTDLGPAQLKQFARDLKLDAVSFDQCLDSGKEAAAIQADVAEGKSLGLTGTPSFFVNDHFFSGGVTAGILRDMIKQQLASVAGTETAENPPAARSGANPR